jgi:hypothetical protein
MCPKCGCPGAVIHEAVRLDEEKRRPRRLAAVHTDTRQGQAVLVQQGDAQYVFMDLFLLEGTSSLSITEMGTATPISYSAPELTPEAPLLRFKVSGQPRVEFSAISTMPADQAPAAVLTFSDQKLPATQASETAVARLDAVGAVTAVYAAGAWVPLHGGMSWTEAKPQDLRLQLDLLTRIKESASKGAISAKDADELAKTPWLNPYLKAQATQLLQPARKTSVP